jgi:hypothetical protein
MPNLGLYENQIWYTSTGQLFSFFLFFFLILEVRNLFYKVANFLEPFLFCFLKQSHYVPQTGLECENLLPALALQVCTTTPGFNAFNFLQCKWASTSH